MDWKFQTVINIGNDRIEDNLYDNDNEETTNGVSDDIINTTNVIINIDDDFPMERIVISDDVEIPSDRGITPGTGPSKKLKIISGNANKLHLAADKIKNKYKKKKPLSTLKAKNKKAADWLRWTACVDTDDSKPIDYNNDTNVNDLDDLQTIDYNNDANVADIDDLETIDYHNDTSVGDLFNLKKPSGTQVAAKKILRKYRNLARRKPYQRPLASAATTDFDDLETVDYNRKTSISDLNDIVSGTRKNIYAQKTAKKIPQKYKKIAQKKKNKGKETTKFDDLETVDYNKNTSVSDFVNLKKTRGTQLGAKKNY